MNTTINIGISDDDRLNIANAISHVLADTYTLYLQTHNFHWNVTGPRFRELHLMFEEQYNELALAADEIAERIRTLGYPAPGTYKAFSELSQIEEVDGIPAAESMIKYLVTGNEAVVRSSREALKIAQTAADESTAGLISDRLRIHEKTAWMLRSLLEES